MRQFIIKIITLLIVLIYISGLSKHLIVRAIHDIHHQLTHTLNLHYGHSHSQYNGHEHSHNSFIDFALFEESKSHSHTNENRATLPTIKNLNFFCHLVSCCNLNDIDIYLLETLQTYNFIIPQAPTISPPQLPPQISVV